MADVLPLSLNCPPAGCWAVVLVLVLDRGSFGSGMYLGHSSTAYTVICVSCGFFAYDLFDTLRRRLYNPHSPSILAHNAVLLVCFTTALYRDVTINYLIATLICEVRAPRRQCDSLENFKDAVEFHMLNIHAQQQQVVAVTMAMAKPWIVSWHNRLLSGSEYS